MQKCLEENMRHTVTITTTTSVLYDPFINIPRARILPFYSEPLIPLSILLLRVDAGITAEAS